MPRMQPITTENAQGEAAEILVGVKKKMGMVPNIVATMANSPAVANAYLAFSGAVGQGTSEDGKAAAAVVFARKLSDNRGNVSDDELAAVRDAGYTDGEIAEIVANVALNIFSNYFNHVADPEVDFPQAPILQTA